tara:strand:+ start:168 stop:395 length:228 start_codon:yes stop_codon:yes gene_type:complete
MSKEDLIKKVIKILETSDYIDPVEHLYDGLKTIRRNPDNIADFLWALESPTIIDVDNKVKECRDMLKNFLEKTNE